MECKKCGNELVENSKFCNLYGTKQNPEKEKPNRALKGLGIGCGVIAGLFIFLIITAIVVSSGQATLKLDNVPETTTEESIEVFGKTNAGNKLMANGIDYSGSIESDGNFQINIPIQIGDNEIVLSAIKKDKESSKKEHVIKIRRDLKLFEPLLEPISGSEIYKEEIEIIGDIKESNVAVRIYNENDEQEITSDNEGKFKFKLSL